MRRFLRKRSSSARAPSHRTRLAATLCAPLDPLSACAIVAVFAAAFLTAWIAALASLAASERLLLSESTLDLPSLLEAAVGRAEVWTAQRRLDVRSFARSARLRDALRAGHSGDPRAPGERGAPGTILEEIRRGHAAYPALWLLGDDGTLLAAPEGPAGLPEEVRALAADAPGVRWSEAQQRLLVAEPSEGAVLVAAVRLDSLASDLHALPLDVVGLTITSSSGSVIARAGAGVARSAEALPPVSSSHPIAALETERGGGARLIRDAVRGSAFGWTFVLEGPADRAWAGRSRLVRWVIGVNLIGAGLFVLVALALSRTVTAPLRVLYQDARRIAASGGARGEIRIVDRVFRELRERARRTRRELREKQREVALANEQLQVRNEELQRKNQELARLSVTDDLTRLHNHRFFRDNLPRELKRSLRTGEPLSLVLFDIDDFKALNDRYGHAVGDAILVRVAEVMREAVREVDLLARYGGEEFALLAPGTPVEGAVALAEKVRLSVANARFSVLALEGPQSIQVSISAGVAVFGGDERELFHAADRALYRAKASGKDCVILAE